jgi:hypothetical protein
VEQSLWKAVPHYLRRVSNALKKVYHLEELINWLYFYFINGFLYDLSSLAAYRKATSTDLHSHKVWNLDGR